MAKVFGAELQYLGDVFTYPSNNMLQLIALHSLANNSEQPFIVRASGVLGSV
jgi:hypothetical protein